MKCFENFKTTDLFKNKKFRDVFVFAFLSMFQPETQSNCVVHFVERAIYRRFQESKATRWFGFDKFKKIVYGIRYADNRKWELRKLNIFAKTENCVKVLETEDSIIRLLR